MVADIAILISISNDPLTFVLHSITTLGMVKDHESFITFLFVRLSAFARSLTYLVVKALTPFRPASQL